MKKKLLFFITCILILSLTFALVACDFGSDDNNENNNPPEIEQPNNPSDGGANPGDGGSNPPEPDDTEPEEKLTLTEFIVKCEKASAKVFAFEDSQYEATFSLNNNIMFLNTNKWAIQQLRYWEVACNDINEYAYYSGNHWDADTWPDMFGQDKTFESMTEVFDSLFDDFFNGTDVVEVLQASKNVANTTFADDKYIGKEGTILEGYVIVIGNKQVTFTNATTNIEFTYTIGCGEIIIPQEAKDALDTDIPNSIAEFVQKWIDSRAKYIKEDDTAFLKVYDNICFVEIEDLQFYSEIIGNQVIQWIYNFDDGVWNAYSNVYENEMDKIDAAWPGSISAFFDDDKDFVLKDGMYVGSGQHEGEIVQITANRMIVTNTITGHYTELVIGGVDQIVIPQDIRDVYEGN